MNWTKHFVVTALAAALIASPATAYADDPVPSVDQIVDLFHQLTDPDIPAVNKTNIVTPGFTPLACVTLYLMQRKVKCVPTFQTGAVSQESGVWKDLS